MNARSNLTISSATMSTTGLINGLITLAALVVLYLRLPEIANDQLIGIATILAEVTTGLMGFMIASMAILLTLGDSQFINNLRKTGHFGELVNGMLRATLSCFVALIIMVICLVIPVQFLVLSLSIGMSVLVLGLLFIFQAGGRFSLIIEHLH